jgi:predicted metal-dependent peptidase
MTLYLVCDISGSMGDGGKHFIMRTAVMAVAQWVRLEYGRAEISLCAWASEARRVLNWSVNDEYPEGMLTCGGTSNVAALIQLLGEKPDGKVLLLTDGFWSRDDAKILKKWKECLLPETLRIIKIGADANPQIKGSDVFTAEELFAALDCWLQKGSA